MISIELLQSIAIQAVALQNEIKNDDDSLLLQNILADLNDLGEYIRSAEEYEE